MLFLSILQKLNIQKEVLSLAKGDVVFPVSTFLSPAHLNYPFVPNLIPILSNNNWPGYIGVFYNWFNPTEIKYVSYYCETNTWYELAFNYKQLVVFLAFNFYLNLPVLEDAGDFCKNVGLCDNNKLEEFFKGMNCIEDLKKHPIYKDKMPTAIIDPDFGIGLKKDYDLNFIESELKNGNYSNAWNLITLSNIEISKVKNYMSIFVKNCENQLFSDYIKIWNNYQ